MQAVVVWRRRFFTPDVSPFVGSVSATPHHICNDYSLIIQGKPLSGSTRPRLSGGGRLGGGAPPCRMHYSLSSSHKRHARRLQSGHANTASQWRQHDRGDREHLATRVGNDGLVNLKKKKVRRRRRSAVDDFCRILRRTHLTTRTHRGQTEQRHGGSAARGVHRAKPTSHGQRPRTDASPGATTLLVSKEARHHSFTRQTDGVRNLLAITAAKEKEIIRPIGEYASACAVRGRGAESSLC